jgi:hypothetical protein
MRVEVAVHTAHEHSPKLLTDQHVLYIGQERPEKLCNKAHGPSFDVDVESNV